MLDKQFRKSVYVTGFVRCRINNKGWCRDAVAFRKRKCCRQREGEGLPFRPPSARLFATIAPERFAQCLLIQGLALQEVDGDDCFQHMWQAAYAKG